MNSILNPAYPHIVEKIFTCLNFDLVSISNFRLLNHQLKNTLENVLTKDLARLILLRKFKELTHIRELEETHRDIFQRLGKIWLKLIELLNQENLWSHDVTEDVFLCVDRICCLIQHRRCNRLSYLQTYYLEPIYLALNLGNKFGNTSLIKIINKPAYSANFMISTSHEHIRDDKESHGSFLWQVTCTNLHE